MNWREAFFCQARSDYEIWRQLNTAGSALCHQLHYLQMLTEKLAKGYLTDTKNGQPPPMTHSQFVRLLQVLKGQRQIREQLGYADQASFSSYIDSLLPIAREVEALAPAIGGPSSPNTEYPWQDGARVRAPAEFEFPSFRKPGPQLVKLYRLLDQLVQIGS